MIACRGLHIKQGDFSIENINFQIETNTYAVLMGKTGCGKTTLLEAICGLRKVKAGTIWLDHQNITHLSPPLRGIGYVPQDGALFKTMNVAQNIGYSLKIRKWDRSHIKARVTELTGLLKIDHLLKRKSYDLSGGEVQRVALARALSFYPKILCLDEPLSALDEETKESMYEILNLVKESLDITVLHVSHSKTDALKLADKVLLFDQRKVNEFKPEDLTLRSSENFFSDSPRFSK